MALKLTKKRRWVQVRNYLNEHYGINVNFCDNHKTYYSAYSYATKEDQEVLLTENHPDLRNSPKTEKV